MEVKVIASTKMGYVASKEELDHMGGLMAGVCYLPNTIDGLLSESSEKTERRMNGIKMSGHHSPFDHCNITLAINDIPKIVAMIINNEKYYVTSEKSARYKRMPLPEKEEKLYNKWLELYQASIHKEYDGKAPKWFTDVKITKLAQENARYLTSIFNPTTSMVYTVTYRQFNILIGMFRKEIELLRNYTDGFSVRLKEELEKFLFELEKLPYVDDKLADNFKNRSLSLIDRSEKPIIKYFGDVYVCSYMGSFALLAQGQRHRTMSYSFSYPITNQCYIPPIIKNNRELCKMWQDDFASVADNFPQGTLINITEKGTMENFILKLYERNCSQAQLEIDNQTTKTKKEMYEYLKETNHPQAERLESFMKGSRCTFTDFSCNTPCNFYEGVIGERKI